MAGVTGLEPATSGVTGQRSNQLSYTPFKEKVLVKECAWFKTDWHMMSSADFNLYDIVFKEK